MQNKRWNRIRVGIAAVITSVSFAGANTVSVECAKQITPETITEEPTTQDFMDLIEYTKDWQTAEEVTPESVTMEESQSTEVTQKDPMTMVPIKGIHACYGRIVEIRDNYILVQGLEENAINDQGIDWYSKSDVAAVSGYVDGHECTSVDDLKVGDFVCAIRFGYMHYTITNYFDGIAKFIVISRDVKENEKAADKDLTRAAVHYAEKIAAKAADNDYLNKMDLSDNAMQYAQSAAGLLNIVPEEIMEINLEDAVSSMFIGKININSDLLNIKTNLFGNLVNREVDEEMTAAFNALTEDEYLSTYYPLLSDGAVALWLYYGEKLPSVFTTFVPKSKIEGEKVKTSNTTEIRAILTEPSTYQQVCALMENGGEGDPIKTALARNADIYNDLDSFNPLNSNQGYYVGESKEAADETFYRTVAYDSIQSADCIKLISGLSNNVEQKLYGVQETLIAALTGVAPGTLEAYYVSKENNNQYVFTDIRNAAFNAMQDTTNQTAAWNFSQIIHSQMSAYSVREGWDRDVLLVYSFSNLTVLVTIEQGDNNFMKVTPLLVLTEENNENLGSQDQIDSFIQSLLEQYKFEKFDIAN